MHLPQDIRENNPLRKFAQASLEKPGMYLIALRTHLGRGKTIIGDVISSVAEVLPKPTKLQETDEA